MIFLLNRVHSDLVNFRFETLYKNQKVQFDQFKSDGTVSFKSNDTFIAVDVDKKTDKQSERVLQGVFGFGENNGHIYYSGDENASCFNGMYYWTFELVNKTYTVYEVCLGRKGIYLCIYDGDELIAQISKNTKTKNNNNQYEIFSKKDVFELLSCICIFWDMLHFPPGSVHDFGKMNAWNRELREKYDGDFIKNVKNNFYGV